MIRDDLFERLAELTESDDTAWPDHLVPSVSPVRSRSDINRYREHVGKLLAPSTTAGGDFFVVCFPSFRPEWGISAELSGDTIALRFPSEPIWPQNLQSCISVQCIEVSFDRPLLVKIERVWCGMLYAVRPFRASAVAESLWACRRDGESYTFGYHRPNRTTLTGEAWSPSSESRPGRLVTVAQLLRSYCTASNSERPDLARSIQQAADWFEADGLTR
jgi:hypothetical protein